MSSFLILISRLQMLSLGLTCEVSTNGALAPFQHHSFVIFLLDEWLVDHLDHHVAAEDTFRGHKIVQLHSQLKKNQ